MLTNKSTEISAFELSKKEKKSMSLGMLNPNPSNILDPVKVVDNSSINSWAPNRSTLVTP